MELDIQLQVKNKSLVCKKVRFCIFLTRPRRVRLCCWAVISKATGSGTSSPASSWATPDGEGTECDCETESGPGNPPSRECKTLLPEKHTIPTSPRHLFGPIKKASFVFPLFDKESCLPAIHSWLQNTLFTRNSKVCMKLRVIWHRTLSPQTILDSRTHSSLETGTLFWGVSKQTWVFSFPWANSNKVHLMGSELRVVQFSCSIFHVIVFHKFHHTSSILIDIRVANVSSFSHVIFQILPTSTRR